MSSVKVKYAIGNECPDQTFDWSMYEDGWNGKSLKVNSKIKTGDMVRVFCHDSYADEEFNKFRQIKDNVESKELVDGTLTKVIDLTVLNSNELLATVNEGANNICIDLSKEGKFFNIISNEKQHMTKETFIASLMNPEFKKQLLAMNLSVKIGTKGEKAGIWTGYVENLVTEMKESITKNDKAYWATVEATNNGGYVVNIMDALKAFMPGSMAAANRITDFDQLVGKKMEVMVENWNPKYGFVVSRKKFLKTIMPIKLANLAAEYKNNPDTIYHGKITGATSFGIFVEIDEYLTGMLHKSLVSDTLRQSMKDGTVKPGESIDVYVHKIEDSRIILSDVPVAERDGVIALREKEDEQEKRYAKSQSNSHSLSNEEINKLKTKFNG